MKKIFLLLPALSCLSFAFAQQSKRCGTAERWAEQTKSNPALLRAADDINRICSIWIQNHPEQSATATIRIPVVFHIVYKSAAQNLSDNKIVSQIDVMNKDFQRLNADTINTPAVWKPIAGKLDIEFCLAARSPLGIYSNGITRTLTQKTSFTVADSVKFSAHGGEDAWDRNKYLNIWVCNLSASGGVLGVTSNPSDPPELDGIVVKYTTVGNPGSEPKYDLGRTLTHEAGHWLGLVHPWGDDGGTCSGTDNINDTPNQADASFDCKTFPFTDACTTASPGIMFMNYMDYSDDVCMNLFTADQKTRMMAILNTTRSSIQSSNGCVPLGLDDATLDSEDFILSPNPAMDLVKLNMHRKGFDEVEIYDLLGNQIFKKQFPNQTTLTEINTASFPNGVYLVRVQNSGTVISRRMIIHR